jgi:hypothetical protein
MSQSARLPEYRSRPILVGRFLLISLTAQHNTQFNFKMQNYLAQSGAFLLWEVRERENNRVVRK